MCRWNSGFFYNHPRLLDYDYHWPTEPNVHLFCDIDRHCEPVRRGSPGIAASGCSWVANGWSRGMVGVGRERLGGVEVRLKGMR